MKRIILYIILMLLVGSTLFAQSGTTQPLHPTGSGTASDPYLIESLANLRWMSENSSEWWDFTNNTKYFKQTENIDAAETMNWNNLKGFKPIGHLANIITDQGVTTGTWFLGVYDGNGKTITNLYINQEDATPTKTGMFSMIHDAEIKNLGLVNSFLKANPPTNGEGTTLGGIVGLASSSTIDNCYITGKLEAYAGYGNVYIGGIAGYVRSSSTIINCYSTSSVKGTYKSFGDIIEIYSGGITGFLGDNSNISNCYNTGEINGVGTISRVGGIVSDVSSSTINNCYSNVSINSTSYGSQKVVVGAGVAATVNNGSISQNFSTGTISTSGSLPWVGGIAGDINNTIIENCYSKITLPSFNQFSGGIAGRVYSSASTTISKCYFAGSISSTGGAIAGGIQYGSALNIQNCLWDNQKTGLNSAIGSLPNGNVVNSYGKITAEMKLISTYTSVEWDFENIWAIDHSINEGYAYLKEDAGPSAGIFNISSDENSILVYPNPTIGQLIIEKLQSKTLNAEIVNLNGCIVGTFSFNHPESNTLTIDISHLPEGFYLLKLGNETIKIVKH